MTTADQDPAPTRDLAWTLALSVAIFVVYTLGACRTIYVGDSGELVTAVYLLGIPHPTGYPLYVLLGKLWTLVVPIGSIAFRMSLFSAACAAGACGVLYHLSRRMGLDRASACFAALLLAFSPSFWSQANIQRVYSLNALFVLLAATLAWRWYGRRRPRDLARAFLVCGLGATNHTFMAVAAICLGMFAVVVDPSLLVRWRSLGLFALSFLTGLLPYLYLPLRSRADPRLDWGNPETSEAFLDVVLRRGFWERAWVESPLDHLTVAGDFFYSLMTELAWVGPALALVGLFAWRRYGKFLLLPLLWMAANLTLLALHGSRSDIFLWHRYYIPSYALAALLAGLGLHHLVPRMPPRAALAALIAPAVLLVQGWSDHDRSRYRIIDSFSRALLSSLPPGSHLTATDDNILFSLMYLHLVEKMRPDVDLILQGVGGELPPLKFNPDTDPVFFTHHPNWDLPALEIVPVGVVFRASRRGSPLPEPLTVPPRLEGETDPRVPQDYLTGNVIGQFHYMLGVTFEQRDWPRAREQFELARAAAPGNDVLFYNLGLIFRRNGLIDDAVVAFSRCEAINPRHLASHDRPRAADKLSELRAERARLARLEQVLMADSTLQGGAEGTPAHHRRMAELLAARGEPTAARGHELRAQELALGP